MNESKKIIRAFILITVWILFVTITLSGLLIAADRTGRVMTGTIAVQRNSNLSGFLMHN